MKNKLFFIVSSVLFNNTLLTRTEHSVILASIKQLRTADEMIMDLTVKKADLPQEILHVSLNAYEIKQAHFLQAIKTFNIGLTDLAKNTEGITTEDDHEIRRRGEHFITNGARALKALSDKVNRQDLALGLKSAIKHYKDYAQSFVENRINEFDEEADAVYEEDGAATIALQSPLH